MTRVLLDVTSLRTASAGVRRYVEGLRALLDELGPEVTSVERAAPVPGYGADESALRKGWRHVALLFWYQVALPWQAWRARADVVICPEYYCPWFAPSPRAVVFHDTFFWDRPEYAGWWKALLRINSLLPARRANMVVTVSAAVRPRLAELVRRDPNEIEVLTTFVEAPADDTVPGRFASLGLAPGYLLHVGALEKRKQLPFLLESYALARRLGRRLPPLVLAGPPSPIKALDDSDAIRATIAREELDADVVLSGMVPDAVMPALFRHALALVFVSRAEGFGIPLAEAMAAGIPVVAVRSAPTCEVVGDAALLVEADDAEALAGALARVATDEDLRQKLIAAGREQARRYSRASVAATLSSMLRRLAQ